MNCARSIAQLRDEVSGARREGHIISLVPTMGALHAGHGALIDRARRDSGFVVASIFVNPIQFDRREDYDAYAINLHTDLDFCAARGVDAVFAPSPAEMYPAPIETTVDVAALSEHLCGKFRPGHFRGVATVVAKLFHIVVPDRAYFGEKDAQQLAIIRRMVTDLNFPIEIVAIPTVREPDGLALSSRNARLTPEERAAAPVLYQALQRAHQRLGAGCCCANELRKAALEILGRVPQARVEYLEVVDEQTMQPLEEITGPVRIAAAVWFGETRLIDNVGWQPSL
jgi:pantoate--beta-alanine ligase